MGQLHVRPLGSAMKIYVKDIMPEDPIFWAELGMRVKEILRVMVDRNFTLLPVRNAEKAIVGTLLSDRS